MTRSHAPTADNMFIAQESDNQRKAPNKIETWDGLYPWLLRYVSEEGEQRTYNKAIADFCEVVVQDPLLDPGYEGYSPEGEDFGGSLLGYALNESASCQETRTLSADLIRLAATLYPMTGEDWDEVCIAALDLTDLLKQGGLLEQVKKNGKWRLIGSKALTERYGITVRIKMSERIW